MSVASETSARRARMHAVSWGIWAERAVVRALEIDPDHCIQAGLLYGQPVSQVAFVIARAVGYLVGTQRAPDLPEEIRAWIDRVASCDGSAIGTRLGGLSPAEWAERAAVMALEIDAGVKIAGGPLHGEHLWEVAITIARAVGGLAGTRRTLALPVEVIEWLHGAPLQGAQQQGRTSEGAVPAKEDAR